MGEIVFGTPADNRSDAGSSVHWVQKYDYSFAPIQTKPDWKDRFMCTLSLSMLGIILYNAIANS